jgi:glycosyltransferase involved in cell wall biosynthesis
MTVSILIPAHNEEKYLNRTIENIFDTATGEIEVIVVLNGYDQEVDSRAKVVRYSDNMGERLAMNAAARIANGEYLLRIDAHCDFSPKGWDEMMAEVTRPRSITVAVLTALNQKWERLPGHWYGLCRLLPNFEAKWETPNENRDYPTVVPNMAFTGCGFMLTKEFYMSFGGADESLPLMGAIGEEFAVRAWLEGEGAYTRTDVIIGHIFDTGGYGTGGVIEARRALCEKFGHRYDEIAANFPQAAAKLRTAAVKKDEKRTVIINQTKEHFTKDTKGRVLKKRVEHFKYIWVDDGSGLTEQEVQEKYLSRLKKVGETLYLPDQNGKLVKVA